MMFTLWPLVATSPGSLLSAGELEGHAPQLICSLLGSAPQKKRSARMTGRED